MDHHQRFRNDGNSNNGGRGTYHRYSRSRSKSRERGREQNYRQNRRNSRSRSRDRGGAYRQGNNDNDLYRDIINQDYQDEENYMGGAGGGGNSRGSSKFRPRSNEEDYGDDRCDRYYNERPRNRDRDRDYDNRDRRDRDRGRDNKSYGRGGSNGGNGGGNNNRRYNSVDRDDSDASDDTMSMWYSSQNQTPSNIMIVLGLQSNITEADIMSSLIQADIAPAAIRLIRKRTTGASRGFAFVEFDTTREAAQWMEFTQGTVQLNETCRAVIQYSLLKDWHCGKCGVFNFKRRGNCFKCYASRDDCETSTLADDEDLMYAGGGKLNSRNKSEWYCIKCHFVNFRRRETCFKCNASRGESVVSEELSIDDLNSANKSEWYCSKCNVTNFRCRDTCFKCCASRGERGYGVGSEEISSILTKKIMLRNLDVLTNEEGVLTAITEHAPDLAKKITKVLVSRDALTQTSLGICYLNFESLVDSMNMHNLLSTLEPPLTIDDKEVIVTYCVDHENRELLPKKKSDAVNSKAASKQQSSVIGPMTASELVAATAAAANTSSVGAQYTLDDVPRLAEYSASLYATTPAEHAHYLKYYTDYYIKEINSGSYSNLPKNKQVTEVNSAAAVALSAIKRMQAKMSSIETTATASATATAAAKTTRASVVTPKGNDGKVYPTPDVSLYQYDETSGYYYDPTTGLYYDAHSQYYYNNETGAYLYWDQRKSTYILATPAAVAATVQAAVKQESETNAGEEGDAVRKDKREGGGGHKHDKVKVAKKIVKDMEKWAKQLNQKKDYVPVATPQTSQTSDDMIRPSTSAGGSGLNSGYADVGFSILEKKAANKLSSNFMSPIALSATNKLIPAYGSDSEEDVPLPPKASAPTEASEKDYVDFQKLTCLLCKRAFQSLEILQKHLKMSNLHKENLAKLNASRAGGGGGVGSSMHSDEDNEASLAAALSYRDRAKERRLKYGEYDPPLSNPSRERFQKEIKNLTSRSKEEPVMPIGSNNVGNRLLQKMGWSEGQGLGRKNQGRTNIIEANTRNSTAGLGTQAGPGPGPGDYKTYIKKMMKARYESV